MKIKNYLLYCLVLFTAFLSLVRMKMQKHPLPKDKGKSLSVFTSILYIQLMILQM